MAYSSPEIINVLLKTRAIYPLWLQEHTFCQVNHVGWL